MRSGEEFAGRYVLKEVIGAGRGGEVWRAHDRLVGQDVALKPERIEGDLETAVRRLLGEPRAMAKFRDHPHVVTLFDVVTVPPGDDAPETYWFVMEYVPGGGLDRLPRMSPQRAARVGAQLADALAALHGAGIVHCDVKPANVGLTRHGDAKLLDFGAAHRVGGTETITANGPFSFTPDYAAPELARGNVPRPASDMFCLAATLHALVTGSPPRGGEPVEAGEDGEDAERLTYWKAEQGVVDVDADAVGPLYPALTAMLRRDPRQRPGASEVERLLTAVAGTVSDTPSADRRSGRPRRRRMLLGAAVGVAAALALGVALAPGGSDGSVDTRGAANGLPADGATATARQSLVGDPHTADLCALSDPAALGRFGRTEVDVDYGNFDRCELHLYPDDESRIDVTVHLRRGTPPETARPTRTVGRIGIMEEQPESDECGRLLLPPDDAPDSASAAADGVLLAVRANEEEGSVVGGAATLCTVADSAARSAAEVLGRGPVPRRPQAYPAASLAWANACELLDAEALSIVPGIEAGAPEVGVANWDCEWFSDVDDLGAEIAFHRDQPKTSTDGDPVRLGGHDAVVRKEDDKEDDNDSCTVFVKYREYGGRNADTYAEMLRVDTRGRRPVDDLCAMATDLATSAAAKLPAR
ncbi:serine/threonine-protein kinase [Streptomyces sp. NPDC127178]|uniref:serine/threonine-protein kinase n=1 Tax=unclassified Streptomyces TaxID=2593676 RepID=UPI0036287F9E